MSVSAPGGALGVLAVLIPTRNRADLAETAALSVLEQAGDAVRVVISDNSTSPEQRASLAAFVRKCGDPRLRRIEPTVPLSMSAHWDWAVEQCLSEPAVSHLAVLTDRMAFKRGRLAPLLRVVASHADRVVTFSQDRVNDRIRPVRLEQQHWSGRVLTLPTQRLLGLAAGAFLHPCLPRLLNCVVPRSVLESVRSHHGHFCDSAAPDFYFCFRCLALEESLVFYDRAPVLHYAIDRSNGASFVSGVLSPDADDFLKNLRSPLLNPASPVPGLATVASTIYHEYNLARAESAPGRLPELDLEACLALFERELHAVEDPAFRQEQRALLDAFLTRNPAASAPRTQASDGPPEVEEAVPAGARLRQEWGWIAAAPSARSRLARLGALFLILAEKGTRSVEWLLAAPPTKGFWFFTARRFGLRSPGGYRFAFADAAQAVWYGRRCDRFRFWSGAHLRSLVAREGSPAERSGAGDARQEKAP